MEIQKVHQLSSLWLGRLGLRITAHETYGVGQSHGTSEKHRELGPLGVQLGVQRDFSLGQLPSLGFHDGFHSGSMVGFPQKSARRSGPWAGPLQSRGPPEAKICCWVTQGELIEEKP